MDRLKSPWRKLLDDTSGQGIVEYGAIIAFVSLLVAMVFAFASSSLYSAISSSHSSVTGQITALNKRSNQ